MDPQLELEETASLRKGDETKEQKLEREQKDRKDGPRAWLVCLGFHIAVLLNFGTSRTLGIFLADWQSDFQVVNSVASLVPSGCFSMMGMACLLTTFLHGRVTPRRICLAGGLLGGAAFVAASRSPSFGLLTVLCIVGFIGCTASYITAFVTLGAWTDRFRPLAFALANSGSPIAGMIFPKLFTHLTNEWGWRGCFLIIAAFFLHHCLSGMLMKPFRGGEASATAGAVEKKVLLKDPRYLLVLPYMFFHFGSLITGIVYHPSWARVNGIDDDGVATLVLILGASDLCVRLVSGPLLTIPAVRRRILWILIGNEILTVIGAIVMGLCRSFGPLVGASAIYGIAYGNWFTVYFSFLADFYGTPNLSNAIGFSLFVGGISNLVLPPVLGQLKELFNYFQLVFYLAGGIASFAVMTLIALLIYDNKKKGKN